MSSLKYLCVGKIGKPHGLKGAFFVAGRDTPLPDMREICIGEDPEIGKWIPVSRSYFQGDREILEVSTITSRTSEGLIHQPIWIKRSELNLSSEEFLWIDLEGQTVFADDGCELGVISQVANYGASDIVEIESGEKILSLPLISDYFILPMVPGPVRLKQNSEFFSDLWELKRET
jgi:16S rRNA processing protein RimM